MSLARFSNEFARITDVSGIGRIRIVACCVESNDDCQSQFLEFFFESSSLQRVLLPEFSLPEGTKPLFGLDRVIFVSGIAKATIRTLFYAFNPI